MSEAIREPEEDAPIRNDAIAEKKARSQRPSTERKQPSQRPSRTKNPQDHKDSKAAADAQLREATGEDGLVTVEYEGFEFEYDPAEFDIQFQLMAEQGMPARALLKVLGAEQMERLYKKKVDDLEDLIQFFAKAAGLGNS